MKKTPTRKIDLDLENSIFSHDQSERRRRLALATGFGSQTVWNRSKRCAGARGGARAGRPRWLRILTITGGSSMAALRRRLRTGDDLQGAAAVRAVFDVDV